MSCCQGTCHVNNNFNKKWYIYWHMDAGFNILLSEGLVWAFECYCKGQLLKVLSTGFNILHFCTCHLKENQGNAVYQFSSCKSLRSSLQAEGCLIQPPRPASWDEEAVRIGCSTAEALNSYINFQLCKRWSQFSLLAKISFHISA